ncbi:MAG: hypothetical protein WBL74_04015 [Novosphingobium sp.]|uniref:hypothetical protein n=1 Tax=Novosphingobium sp. TaxID=1874826 RepID=UPI003C79BFC4
MRTLVAFVAILLLAACHKGDPAQEPAHEAAVTGVPATSAPSLAASSPITPSAIPSMIAPVDAPPRAAAKVAGLPDDVTRLSERISSCEHFAGEEAYDAERGALLRQQIDATCPGNAAELQRLRTKYAANPAIARHLAALEAIEM